MASKQASKRAIKRAVRQAGRQARVKWSEYAVVIGIAVQCRAEQCSEEKAEETEEKGNIVNAK